MIDVPIIHAIYDTYACWHQLTLRFPKSQRFSLGQKCGEYLLSTLELMLSATAARDTKEKLASLSAASAKLDTLKLLIRLSKDCKCLSPRHYQAMETRLYRIGKMLGGWIKSLY